MCVYIYIYVSIYIYVHIRYIYIYMLHDEFVSVHDPLSISIWLQCLHPGLGLPREPKGPLE